MIQISERGTFARLECNNFINVNNPKTKSIAGGAASSTNAKLRKTHYTISREQRESNIRETLRNKVHSLLLLETKFVPHNRRTSTCALHNKTGTTRIKNTGNNTTLQDTLAALKLNFF